jgi:hypothetical protein
MSVVVDLTAPVKIPKSLVRKSIVIEIGEILKKEFAAQKEVTCQKKPIETMLETLLQSTLTIILKKLRFSDENGEPIKVTAANLHEFSVPFVAPTISASEQKIVDMQRDMTKLTKMVMTLTSEQEN